MHLLSSFSFGDTVVEYPYDSASGQIGLRLVPLSKVGEIVARRDTLAGVPEIDLLPDEAPAAWEIDPLVHVKLVGDSYTGAFAQGHTMLASPSNVRFRYRDQYVIKSEGDTTVVTSMVSNEGLVLEHRLSWRDCDAAFRVTSALINNSKDPVKVEHLSAFSLGGLTPFAVDDATGRLQVHRFRSVWSAEGRHETRSLEDLHLERSWSGASALSERFGQVGSMPVRKWFPFVALEDSDVGVVWAAQLAWAGSWQMEVFRQHDTVCLTGGQADREFGHWMKTLKPGETLESPEGRVTAVVGSLDTACYRLTALQAHALDAQPAVEQSLPIIFNEWCTTWGNPTEDRMDALSKRLAGTGVKYLVIDAGWYQGETGDWSTGHGDWVPSRKLFPNGLKVVADQIRAQGLVPGLWFEMETVGDCSTAFSLTNLLLKRDGLPLTVRNRRFWDLSNPKAVDYLTERVIDLLKDCGFGFLKVDYNETIGLGSDHADGVGEGLRQQTLGTYRFFQKIREALPDLVIENCSSGGHRLEPSMLEATAISSFSDAHETVEIPIVAANLHRLMLPRQSEIWAVLHASDSGQRLVYSLAATFLGRMALSGDVDKLDASQWARVQAAIDLYLVAMPIIREGVSRYFGAMGASWRHPQGWQAVVRYAMDGASVLVVAHGFAECPDAVSIYLEGNGWNVVNDFHADAVAALIDDGVLQLSLNDFSGRVVLLSR